MSLFNILFKDAEQKTRQNIFLIEFRRENQDLVEMFLFFDQLNSARMGYSSKAVRLNTNTALELFSLNQRVRCNQSEFAFDDIYYQWKKGKKKSFVHITLEDALTASNEALRLLDSALSLYAPSKC